MQVRHGFATVCPVVEDETIAGLFEAQFLRDFSSLEQQMTERLMIGGRGLGDARDGFLRNDQDVSRCFGRDVVERDHEVVFINDLRRDFARDDFFKQGFAHGWDDLTAKHPKHSKRNSLHEQRTGIARRFVVQCAPEKFHDLIAHGIAARTPTLCADQQLHATAQALEAHEPGRHLKL